MFEYVQGSEKSFVFKVHVWRLSCMLGRKDKLFLPIDRPSE